jgi:hypothetical protein
VDQNPTIVPFAAATGSTHVKTHVDFSATAVVATGSASLYCLLALCNRFFTRL